MAALLKEAGRGREMIRNFGFGFFWLIFRRLFVSDRPQRGYFTRFSLPLF